MEKSNIVIAPWKKSRCKGARLLAEYYGCRCHGITWLPRAQNVHVIVNWGSSVVNNNTLQRSILLNFPGDVRKAINKAEAFARLRSAAVPIPEVTCHASRAYDWVHDGREVVQRMLVKSSGGRGINIIYPFLCGEINPAARMWTKLFPKTHEYRVHVASVRTEYKVIDLQSKINKDLEREEMSNIVVWNLSNGFKYYHNFKIPEDRRAKLEYWAVKAVKALGLNFGAVDIAYNKDTGKFAVFEVNTAPGITRTKSLEAYAGWLEEVRQSTVRLSDGYEHYTAWRV